MTIEINAKYPIGWDREYYLVGSRERSVFAPCIACDNEGRVEVKGVEYKCPRCFGNWREKEVVSKVRVYHVEKYKLERVEVTQEMHSRGGIRLRFEQRIRGVVARRNVTVRQSDFETMKVEFCPEQRCLLDDYKEAMRQVKEANAAEKAGGEKSGHDSGGRITQTISSI